MNRSDRVEGGGRDQLKTATEAGGLVVSDQRRLPVVAARLEGRVCRALYRALLSAVVQVPVDVPRELPFSVFALCSQRHVPQQVASLRSFLRHVGRPTSYTVISDGTLTASSGRLLRRLDPSVEVSDWREVLRPSLPEIVLKYAGLHPMGKKLALELSLPVDRPTMYVDSDVLFFSTPDEHVLQPWPVTGWYLLDCEAYLDERILVDPGEARQPVNAGFFILYEPLDWTAALARLAGLRQPPVFHTEQTLVHLAMRTQGAQPLNAERYVVAVDDMHAFRDEHAARRIVLRHYTTPVRHKFWCSLGRT